MNIELNNANNEGFIDSIDLGERHLVRDLEALASTKINIELELWQVCVISGWLFSNHPKMV